ncbi:MAG: DUF2937 family protein [Pseudomonadota bacterium]
MSRFLALILGVLGAVGASQAPEFTQQYTQNLLGRIAALTEVVENFDEDAARSGLSRSEALRRCLADEQPAGALSCRGRADDVALHERYKAQYEAIEDAGEWQKPIFLARNVDRDIFDSTLSIYEPAVPATIVGGGFAAAGFAVFWGIAAMIFGTIGSLFGGRRY